MKKNLKKKPLRFSTGLSRFLMIAPATVIVALTAGLVISFSRPKSNSSGTPTVIAKQPTVATSPKNYITRKIGSQTVQIDPQTGQVQPLTPDEARRLAEGLKEMANQSSEGLKQVKHADGSVSMDLEGRFQNVAVARKEADGTVAQSCIDNPQAGAAFFRIDPKLVEPDHKDNSASATKSPNK